MFVCGITHVRKQKGMGNIITRLNEYRMRMKNLTDVFEGKVPKVLLLGLDNAGKTSMLYKSKLDNTIYANFLPRGINIEHMRPKRGARIQIFDLPGSKITRHLWHNWLAKTEAIVYVVDASDKVRIDEAKFELHELLQSRHLVKVPLIVVANKRDAEGALSADEVQTELDLALIQDRDWSIYAVSSKTGNGIKPVFVDVVEKIKAFRHFKSGLGSPLKDRASTKKKPRSIEDDDEPKFTCIEDTDANDNDKTPSLFASINKSEKVTDLDADSDVVPSTSSNDQPMYASPPETNGSHSNGSHSNGSQDKRSQDNGSDGNGSISNRSDDRTSEDSVKAPSPDSASNKSQIVEEAQIEINHHEEQIHDVDEVEQISGKMDIGDESDDDDNDIESKSDKVDTSVNECVQRLDDVVKDEDSNSTISSNP